MVQLSSLEPSTLDIFGGGVAGDVQDFVVVLRFGTFEESLRVLKHRIYLGVGGAMVFFGGIESTDGGFEIIRVDLRLRLMKERRKGVRGEGEEGNTVWSTALVVVHLSGHG